MIFYHPETGEHEAVWPSRGEVPDRAEVQMLRESNRGMWSADRVNIVSPWSFSYPTRLRKEDEDG